MMFLLGLLLAANVNAQNLVGSVLRLNPTGLPAVCNIGDLRTDTNDSYHLKQCGVGNSWAVVGGGDATSLQGFAVSAATPNDEDVLTWNNAASRWEPQAPSPGFLNPMTTAGDLIVGGVSGSPGRLGIGAANTVLQTNGSAASWAKLLNANIDTLAGIDATKIADGSVTSTEFQYNDATSSIQTQINSKQATGNYITALTGDGTATGPNSVSLTLATVNSNVGSFGSSTSIPSFTVNGKGLVTAASGNAVVAPAGTLSGNTLAAGVTGSSLTSVGTIGTGTWQGSVVGMTYGGSSKNLTPVVGGTVYTDADSMEVLAAGTLSQVYSSNGGAAPSWNHPRVPNAINMLYASNPNAETNAVSPWTETGGGTLAIESSASNVGFGTYSFSFDASANNDTADSPAITIPEGLEGQNCLLQFPWKGFDTNITFQVFDGTNVLQSQAVSAAATSYQLAQLNFACPTSGTLQMRIRAAGNAAIGYWDEVHLGSATNIGSTVLVTATKAYTPTYTGFGTIASVEMYYTQVGDKLVIEGRATTGTVTGTEARMTLPTGYTSAAFQNIKVAGHYWVNTAAAATAKKGTILIEPSTGYVTFGIDDFTNAVAPLTKRDANQIFPNSTLLSFYAEIPLAGAGNGTVISDQVVRTPTQQVLTSGTAATYTRPAGVTHIRVRLVGAGGGGAGSGTGSGGAGGTGGTTSFGTSLLSAAGGVGGGAGGVNGGVGGAPTLTGITGIGLTGGSGAAGGNTAGTSNVHVPGGAGAATPFGGSGGGGSGSTAGTAGAANTGAGGGGGGVNVPPGTDFRYGGGGGAGAYIEVWIVNPLPTYLYTIGAVGSAGSAGTSGFAGGAGGTGVVIVDEFYGMNAPVMIGQNTRYTCTLSGVASIATTYCFIIPYVTSDGNWRARFNFQATHSSVGSGDIAVASGSTVTFTGNREAVSCNDNSGGSAPSNNFTNGASGIHFDFASNNTDTVCSGDVDLGSKPGFVP